MPAAKWVWPIRFQRRDRQPKGTRCFRRAYASRAAWVSKQSLPRTKRIFLFSLASKWMPPTTEGEYCNSSFGRLTSLRLLKNALLSKTSLYDSTTPNTEPYPSNSPLCLLRSTQGSKLKLFCILSTVFIIDIRTHPQLRVKSLSSFNAGFGVVEIGGRLSTTYMNSLSRN
jgi:hypothetical protein